MTKYEWSLNGTVMATTATYEVPASAKDGDEIKLTVTAEDGETASDTVYVGGLTILKVEPLAQGETYKYVKAYFSSALTSLSPSEIEIRGKKDQKLYSIQTAVLSSDGMAADLTLYGNTDSDSTTFLRPNTTYVMTLTQNGQSTSLEFELPAYATDKIVTSVDMGKNTITTEWSGRTGETGEDGTFNVAGKYDGNLGSLIGRTVNYQYDTDNNLTSFTVDPAEVVYGAMKFVNDSGIERAYFKDELTGETYKVNRTTRTASKNFTWFYAAEDGDEFTPVANTTYNYTKLVLNPDGTVSTANLVENFAQNLFVTDVDGTKVIQDKNNAFDLDGYTIVKDDAYVSPDDLELGDVVFVNTGLKFADVYNNELSGELSNVISGKLDIDETTYNWNGAQYYDEDDDVYKTLSTTADEASQAYLNSLDTETDTTIWIARNKDIKYLAGTVVGQKKYTYTTYLVTDAGAKPYKESLKNKFNIGVFDGTTTSTVTIDLSQLKFYKGEAGKFEAKTDANWGKTGEADIDKFTFTKKNAAAVTANLDLSTDLAAGSLVKFMFDEDNNLVGFSDDEDATDAVIESTRTGSVVTGTSSLNGTDILGTSTSPNLKKDSNKFVQDTGDKSKEVYTMGSFTTLWIWNEKEATLGGTAKDDAFTKVVLTAFDNEIETDVTDSDATTSPLRGISYRVDGTKLTDLVVHILNDDAYEAAENNYINGVLSGVTFKNDETDTTQIMNKITIYGTDGVKATYTANKDATGITAARAKAMAGAYVTLTQNKATEEITDLTVSDGTWNHTTGTADDKLVATHATANFHNDKLILNDTVVTADGTKNIELTTTSDGVIMKRYKKEGSWKYEVVDYTDVNVHDGDVNVWYNTTNVSSDGQKIQSDMIIVELLAKATPVTRTLAVTSDTGTVTADNKISTASGTLTATYTGDKEIATVQWYVNGIASATTTANTPDFTPSAVEKVAGKKVYVKFAAADGTVYESDTYTFADPVATSLSATSGTIDTDGGSVTFNVLDQFGQVANVTAVCTAFTKATTGTLTTAAFSCTSGVCTITAAGAATTENDTYSLTIDLDGAGTGTTTATYALTVTGQS